MRDPIRVLVLGTGQMGSGIARLVLQKAGLELVGAYGRRVHRVGMELAILIIYKTHKVPQSSRVHNLEPTILNDYKHL